MELDERDDVQDEDLLFLEADDIEAVLREGHLERFEGAGPDVVDMVLPFLESSEITLQKHAIEAIGTIGFPTYDVMEELKGLIRHQQEDIRSQALVTLSKFGYGAAFAAREIIGALDDPSSVVKASALTALKYLGPKAKPAAPKLIELIQGEEYVPALLATEVMRKTKPDDPVILKSLGQCLRSASNRVQTSARRILEAIGAPAVPLLSKILSAGTSADEIKTALLTLTRLGSNASSALPEIVDTLNWDDVEIKKQALKAIGSIRPLEREVVEKVVFALHSEELRSEAFRILIDIDHPDTPQMVESLITHPNPEVRFAAVAIIKVFGKRAKATITSLIRALADEAPKTVVVAIEALEAIGDDEGIAIPALIELLDHDHPGMQLLAMGALRGYGEGAKEAIPHIARNLNHTDREIRLSASVSLAHIGAPPESAIPGLIDVLHDLVQNSPEDANERRYEAVVASNIAVMLGKSACPDAVPVLVQALEKGDPWTAESQLQDLLWLDNPAQMDFFQVLFNDSERPRLRESAAWALSRCGLSSLVALFDHTDPTLRSVAVRAVGAIGQKAHDYANSIIPLLRDSKPYVRGLAAQALGDLGNVSIDIIDALVRASDDDDSYVRESVRTTLELLRNRQG